MKKILLLGLFGLLCLVGNLRSQAQECDTVNLYPWTEDVVANHSCWSQLGDNSALWEVSTQYMGPHFMLSAPSGVQADGCVLVSPALALPADTAGLQLSFRVRRIGTAVVFHVLVGTGERDSLSQYDTVYSSNNVSYTQLSFDLAAYAGQTVYLAFSVTKPNTAYSLNSFMVGQFVVESDNMPQGTLAVSPVAAALGDTVSYAVSLTRGSDSLLSYTWHSSLLGTTVVDTTGQLDVVYPQAGFDTMTVTVSNAFGTIVLQGVAGIYACDTITAFPWAEDFEGTGSQAGYDVCWQSSGYAHLASNTHHGFVEEDGSNPTKNDVMNSKTQWAYMLTPPIAVPAVVEDNLSLWLEHAYSLMAVVETDSVADTVYASNNNSNTMMRRTVALAPYAGQTIRVRLLNNSTYGAHNSDIDRVRIDYDTMPVIALAGQAKTTLDSATLFVATLRRGATDGLTYSWSSKVGGTFTTNATGDSAWAHYAVGITGSEDTVTVVASNAYGSDSASHAIHVTDCTPALTLPWRETFVDGTVCWYKPEGSKFYDAIPYSNSAFEYLRHLYLQAKTDTAGSWIMSKEIHIPADTNLVPYLFWKVASSNGSYQHLYSVLITDSADYTDTANYTVLYTDNAAHVNFSNYDQMSVSLAAYAGRSVHVAFHNHGGHLSSSSIGLYLDDIEIRTTVAPRVQLSAPSSVISHEDVAFSAALTEGSTSGLTYTWHSTLMDSTQTTTTPEWNMFYTLGGTDTISLVATNIYGSDTVTSVVQVTDCSPIDTLPWMVDYDIYSASQMLKCWHIYWDGSNATYAPHIVNTFQISNSPITTYLQSNNGGLLMMAGTDSGYDSVAIVESPAFGVPLEGKRLSFHYVYENLTKGALSVGYMQDGAFVPVADVVPTVSSGEMASVILNGIPADVDRFALQWKKTSTWYSVLIDSVQVKDADSVPTVYVQVQPGSLYVGDTSVFNAVLTDGVAYGMTYTWHSTLMDSTIETIEPNVEMVYTEEGEDTMTVIATNAYGADTATAVVSVGSHPLPLVSFLPSAVLVETGDTVTLTPYINGCSTNGLTYTWHSTLLDSTWHTQGVCKIVYTEAGMDSVSLTVSNAYGSDTDAVGIEVYSCLKSLPYTEDFEEVVAVGQSQLGNIPTCWEGYYVTNASFPNTPKMHVIDDYSYFYDGLSSNALLMISGIYNGYSPYVIATLPRMNAGLQNLAISFDYRFETANNNTLEVGYYDKGTSTFTPVDTVPPMTGSFHAYTGDMASAVNAGPDARLALRYKATTSYWAVVVDNITVFMSTPAPLVVVNGPQEVYTGDTTLYTGVLQYGDTDSITYAWQSQQGTIVQQSGAVMRVVYDTPCVDTLTLIATNTYGADTVQYPVAVEWNPSLRPQASIVSEAPFYTCDGGMAIAASEAADVPNYYWSSSLTGTSATGDTFMIAYTTGGSDTLMLIASNMYGVDTAYRVVEVRNCETLQVTDYLVADPAASDADLYCWKVWQFDSIKASGSNTHGRWTRFRDYYHNQRPAMMSNEMNMNTYSSGIMLNMDDWLISPLIELPAAVSSTENMVITLGWNAYSEYTTYHVLVSTTGRQSPADYTDTLLTVVKDYNLTGPWEAYSVDLSAYAGQTVSIAFRHTGPIPYYEHGAVYMDSLQVNVAYEPLPEYTVTIYRLLADGGNVPADCTVSGAGNYLAGTNATIEAHGGADYDFACWIAPTGDTIVDNPYTFMVNANVAYQAIFASVADTSDTTHNPVDTVGIANDMQPLAYALYPNPASQLVMVESAEMVSVSMFDMRGQEVFRSAMPATRHRIDVSALTTGTYFVRISSAEGIATKKLVVKGTK